MRAELIERARSGDHEAFARLVALDTDACFGIAYRILRDVDRAQDAVQQAYLSCWKELPRLRDVDRYERWLQRLLINAAYEEARRFRRWSGRVRELTDEGPGRTDASLGAVDDRLQLEQAFRQLSPEHRAVFVLHHHVGLPLAEIGTLLDIPLGTVKSRLFYATKALQGAIDAGLAATTQEVTTA